ncbi:hypothetical protein SAMN02745673_00809 [Marinactinospora thermotolerans DSM 45154]|uniref:Uncharacterized protein n=1 Tax=Marinactinospora thermotolerans DSM 45154 TaxID=1122192 RepID=A0A1T4LSS6_9ACTN|nr:hypothetical protein [Marinactinospora thermotolerans]SJZ57780.1 hypothetical protein SAMN02745673_00809 [Marinactinospora thermotolerans DSM 45154]
MRWPRRSRPSAEVRARLHLQRGERVLAHAPAEPGTLVATTRALHLPDGRVIPWERVERARWNAEGLELVEEGADETVIALPSPGALPEVVQERVASSILVNTHVALPGSGEDEPRGYRLVARRPPGGSEVLWRVHYDAGVDPQEPGVREHAARALASLRERMGI